MSKKENFVEKLHKLSEAADVPEKEAVEPDAQKMVEFLESNLKEQKKK